MTPIPPVRSRYRLSCLLLLSVLGGCTTVVRGAPEAPVAPALTVERFLQASNSRDLEAMSRLFGTRDGPVGDTGSTFGCMFKKLGSWFGGTPCVSKAEVEIRLDAIARILQHRDYNVVDEEPVAGRASPTRRVFVNLLQASQDVRRLPFVVVRTSDGRWLVESVDLERVMAGGNRI